MIKREKLEKNSKKMAARFARRQRWGGSTPPPPLLAMPAMKVTMEI